MRFETLCRLRYLAKRGDWAFSFDLQDGYYALGLREDVRDYFTINVRGTMSLANRHAPYELLRFAVSGAPSCLLIALRLRAEIERVWGRLGLAQHPTTAHSKPTQQPQHLGLYLDLVTMQFRAQAAKLRRLSNLARDLMCIAARGHRHAPAQLLASLPGPGQFLCLAMPPARFYLREAHTVLGRCSSPSGKVVLTRKLIRDLEWWRDVPTRHNGAPILRPVETTYLHTDSSQYGWAINAFFTDNFKEPPALGPFVNQAMRGWELAQQVLDTPDYRAHPEIAELLEFFVTCRDHVMHALLRSGRASAASATGVPMPTVRWLGGWAVGSGVVLNYIVPGILDSAGARYFFGFLAPQRSASNLSQ
eukprot:jgi/Tetstr1/424592/TSEL_015117.t1